jgi:dodecin
MATTGPARAASAAPGVVLRRSGTTGPRGLEEEAMEDHVYKVVELVGSSKDSIEDAIQTAVKRADKTLRNLRWFEVVQTRGHIENGTIRHYQVVLKAGFTLEADAG